MTREEVETRWRSHSRDNYNAIFGVMKGVTLGSAAIVLATAELRENWTRWPFWVVSFLGLVVTYYGNSIGALLAPLDVRLRSTIVPLLLAVAEFGLFATLAVESDGAGAPRAWYWVFAAFAFLASVVVRSARSGTSETNFDPSLSVLVGDISRGLEGAARGSAGSAAGAFILAASFSIWHDALGDYQVAFAALAAGPLAIALFNQDQDRQRIARYFAPGSTGW